MNSVAFRAEIVTGRSDLWEPDTVAVASRRPDWTYEDGNLQDERLGSVLKGYDPQTRSLLNDTDKLAVEGIKVDAYGGVVVSLSGDYRLAIFPSGTKGEDWRFFRPGTEGAHFVVRVGTVGVRR